MQRHTEWRKTDKHQAPIRASPGGRGGGGDTLTPSAVFTRSASAFTRSASTATAITVPLLEDVLTLGRGRGVRGRGGGGKGGGEVVTKVVGRKMGGGGGGQRGGGERWFVYAVSTTSSACTQGVVGCPGVCVCVCVCVCDCGCMCVCVCLCV